MSLKIRFKVFVMSYLIKIAIIKGCMCDVNLFEKLSLESQGVNLLHTYLFVYDYML